MKFSIRDLLLVTVIVALAVGWYVDHRRISIQATKDREFRSRLYEIQTPNGARNWQRLWGEARPVGDY